MKKFLIKVNGVAYEVEVEEAAASVSAAYAVPVAAAPAAPAAPPLSAAPAAAAPPVKEAVPAGRTGSEVIKAPMPGTILSIKTSPGASVKKNQVLCILEAMKMENEIVATRDGVVAAIHAVKGVMVGAGDPLISLE